jgi:nucleotide-binding universal stress UspA family protein
MQRILVATDGSKGSGRAIDAAADLAAKLDIELWIVHVMDGISEEMTKFAREEGSPIGDAASAFTQIRPAERGSKEEPMYAFTLEAPSGLSTR